MAQDKQYVITKKNWHSIVQSLCRFAPDGSPVFKHYEPPILYKTKEEAAIAVSFVEQAIIKKRVSRQLSKTDKFPIRLYKHVEYDALADLSDIVKVSTRLNKGLDDLDSLSFDCWGLQGLDDLAEEIVYRTKRVHKALTKEKK